MQASNRDCYREFSNELPYLPFCLQAWWLDACCGDTGWDVSLAKRGGEIVGALPYTVRRRWGLVLIEQPMLTPFLGPWLAESRKTAAAMARQKDMMEELIIGLPRFDKYAQAWSPDIGNWLPFFWAGFQQTTRYTMKLTSLDDLDALWKALQENARGDLRKAVGRFNVRLRNNPTLSDFIALNRLTFLRQGRSLPYSETYVRRLDDACAERQRRRIFIAEDDSGRAHAGLYLVWDDRSAYYLMGGSDPQLRSSGAMSFCMWEAIKFAATVTRSFDFEGSMLEPIERFFRSFGAQHVAYSYVTSTPSRILRLKNALAIIR